MDYRSTVSFYITTPIFYVNDVPHLGHAYATIAADALARFHRARGEDTYFLTGTDEHGQKIEQAAAAAGETPGSFADRIVERFRTTWKQLDISNDDFIRTTETRHERVVAAMWQRLEEAGDIYLGGYEGHYCVACEAFYPESQLEPGDVCPIHRREVSWVSEPSYFFRLAKYAQPLLDHIHANPDFIRPANYRNEVVAFVESGLRDLSISRTTFSWGVPVPRSMSPDGPESDGTGGSDDDHVIYVWIDALSNYISALGGPDGALYQRYWPASCHLIGKDILRFHAVYWPCLLMSAGLPLPETIFATGFWTVRGAKIAKSMPATRVDPDQLADDLGVDALRYHVLREIPLGLDGDFTHDGLIARYNADLANDLGNLASRCLTMTDKFCGGVVPPASGDLAGDGSHGELARVAHQAIVDSDSHFADFAPSRALEAIWALVRQTNRYIDSNQPWKLAKELAKQGGEPDGQGAGPAGESTTRHPARLALDHVMRTALEALAITARTMAPVMPGKAADLLGRLGLEGEARAEALGTWPDPDRFGDELVTGATIERGEPLFPRIDKDRAKTLMLRWLGPCESSPSDETSQAGQEAGRADDQGAGQKTGRTKNQRAGSSPAPEPVTFDEFSRFDFRVAVITAAERVPKAKKLLRVELDVGGETRQVVAGIAEAYESESLDEQLVGQKVIFLNNLQPATIRGVRSEGMILAAGEDTILGLATVDRDVPAGTRVR